MLTAKLVQKPISLLDQPVILDVLLESTSLQANAIHAPSNASNAPQHLSVKSALMDSSFKIRPVQLLALQALTAINLTGLAKLAIRPVPPVSAVIRTPV